MKYALISDVHSNLAALEAVLEDIDRRDGVDAIYHLGAWWATRPGLTRWSPSSRSRGSPV